MGKIKIYINHINFLVRLPNYDYRYKNIIEILTNRLCTYSFKYDYKKRRNVRVKDRVFAAINNAKLEYRFNINMLKDFIVTLGQQGVGKDELEIHKKSECVSEVLDLEFNKEISLKNYQQTYENILLDKKLPYMLVDLMTGYGKTILAIHTITKLNKRLGILILPKYIDKWISDVKELTNIKDNELYVVKGGDSLNNLVVLAENGELEAKIVIFSIRTISNYIKEYENALYEDEFSYECKPEELMDKLKMGILLNDETHQEFHAVFKACLYLDPCRFIGLSATLDHNDNNLRRMYKIMFPGSARISNIVDYQPYIHSTSVAYSINSIKHIKYKRLQGYNHILYENSIIKNNILLRDYAEMIEYYFKEGYIKRREEGDKIMIFVASVKMATILTEHLSMKYDYLDVRRYVEDDPYENVMEGDVVVSTVLSAGTALDIRGLITVIQTISIKSLQAVKQAYGRLRNKEGKEMYYYSLYCRNIPNHEANAKSNKAMLLPMSKYWKDKYYDKILRAY